MEVVEDLPWFLDPPSVEVVLVKVVEEVEG